MLLQQQAATLNIVTPIRAYIRYADGSLSKHLRDRVEARWEILEALTSGKLSHVEAYELTTMVYDSVLDQGDQVANTCLILLIEKERAKLAEKGLIGAMPMLVLVAVPMEEEKKPKVVDLKPEHFRRQAAQNN